MDEAFFEMHLPDYDFHLFTESGTGQDSVRYHAGPTLPRLAQPTPPGPHLFFVDADRGRGSVLYHRYDGHYGLITPTP
ncbi:hypothetical protein [Amycolatopsis coloradensis]|uniref:hypothetical protein n=1 Tax=Amycolatopsis coloradensis TaxID=76021 RepID=UPI0030F40EA9